MHCTARNDPAVLANPSAHTSDGVPVSTLQIARRYASSKWFYVDIVSTLPWELLFSALNTPATQTAFKFAGYVEAWPPSSLDQTSGTSLSRHAPALCARDVRRACVRVRARR